MLNDSIPRGPKVSRTCQACGATFLLWPSKIRRYGGRYCSKPCSNRSAHPRRDVAERFWGKVDKRDDDECWPWLGVYSGGYGVLNIGGKYGQNIGAHRISWEIANGKPVPSGLFAMHECDNPPCVNPKHLSVGDQKANLAHMVIVGRSATGDRNANRTHPERMAKGIQMPHAKLTDEKVREMRARHAQGAGVTALAIEFGISHGSASRVIHRLRWKHVD